MNITKEKQKTIKVKYYFTLVAEMELPIAEGEDEAKVIRDWLPDIPVLNFNVEGADYAEVEDEEAHEHRYIKLNEIS